MKEIKKISCSFLCLFIVLGIFAEGSLPASVEYDERIPQLVFAAQELEDLQVALIVNADESSPEAFQIQSAGPNRVEVSGSDAKGAMYGGLELADRIRLGLPIENIDRAPFVEKRGIKFNIPWDARTPSYDDTANGVCAANS